MCRLPTRTVPRRGHSRQAASARISAFCVLLAPTHPSPKAWCATVLTGDTAWAESVPGRRAIPAPRWIGQPRPDIIILHIYGCQVEMFGCDGHWDRSTALLDLYRAPTQSWARISCRRLGTGRSLANRPRGKGRRHWSTTATNSRRLHCCVAIILGQAERHIRRDSGRKIHVPRPTVKQ